MSNNMPKYNYRLSHNSGFSLLEVLIALLILSVGLLGIAALQLVSLKTNHGAYQRSQATILAYDMMDRLRANRVIAMAEGYDIAMAAATPAAPANSPIQIIDLNDWLSNYVSVLLPAGDGSIDCTTAGLCIIIVQWDESRGGGNVAAQFQITSQI